MRKIKWRNLKYAEKELCSNTNKHNFANDPLTLCLLKMQMRLRGIFLNFTHLHQQHIFIPSGFRYLHNRPLTSQQTARWCCWNKRRTPKKRETHFFVIVAHRKYQKPTNLHQKKKRLTNHLFPSGFVNVSKMWHFGNYSIKSFIISSFIHVDAPAQCLVTTNIGPRLEDQRVCVFLCLCASVSVFA